MRVTRRSGAALFLALVAALVGPVGTPTHAADAPREVTQFSFAGPCAGTPGQMHVRQQRLDERVSRVTMRASGIPDRKWGGEITVQARRYALTATFDTTSTDGIARRSSRFPVPVGRGLVDASLFDYEAQTGCDVGGSYDGAGVQVDAGIHFVAFAGDDGLLVSASDYSCRRGSAWRARATIVFPGRTLHKSLGTATCRYGTVGIGRTLPGLGLPNHVEVSVREGAGAVQRASYRIVRG